MKKKVVSMVMAAAMMLSTVLLPMQTIQAADADIAGAASTQESESVMESDSFVFPDSREVSDISSGQAGRLLNGEPAGISTFSVDSVGCNLEEWNVLYITNVVRMNNGLAPLSVNAELQNAADIRKQELTTLFDHKRPNGSDCFSVLDECGVLWNTAGENIARGYTSPQDVVQAWWNSEGHRQNMLTSEFTHMAAGYQTSNGGPYWLQLFTGTCEPAEIRVDEDADYIYVLKPNQSIEETGLALETKCEHGTSYMPIINEMCTGFDSNKYQEIQTVTVSYGGLTDTFDVMVMPFEDVNPGDWFFEYVASVYQMNIMTGMQPTVFGPGVDIPRAQFATILYRMEGEPDVDYSSRFPDVPDGQFYSDPVTWAAEQGIITGYSNGNFGPNDKITREQMVVMMYRYASDYLGIDCSQRADLSGYVDASWITGFAKDAMSWAVANGIISGKDATHLSPQGYACRAECAAIIDRFVRTYFAG